jgi:hypothetical protein
VRLNAIDDGAGYFYIRGVMKTILLSLVLLTILVLPGGPQAADEPAKPPAKGRVIILKNEHTMEGDIERVGDRYRVLCVAASLPDAFGYLRKRANLEDADERLRLANWCRLNGLRQQALDELRAAVELRPGHAPTRRLLEHLRQAAEMAVEPKPAPPAVRPSAADALPPVEVTSESLGLFATRIQPILMNTCARCHATGKGGNFHLTQVYEDSLSDRHTLERNLAAVLAQVNLNQPESSRLLAKAVSDHAHVGQAPLRDRKVAPYRALENWVKLTVDNNPHLRDALPNSSPATPPVATAPTAPRLPSTSPTPEPRSAVEGSNSQWGVEGRPATAPASPTPQPPASGPVPIWHMAATPPPPPAAPADPYDPEVFNRQAHPESSKPAPGK